MEYVRVLGVNLDFNGNESRNMVIQVLAADPTTGKKGQVYFNSTRNVIRQHNGTEWEDAGGIISVDVVSGETVITVDSTDPKNIKLAMNISATQGDSVNVSQETDGLKVEVEDGDTTQKGIVQLVSPTTEAGFADETKGITPKGASVVLEDLATPTDGYLKTYELKQNGLSLGKIDIPKDFLVKEAKVKTSSAYATATAYAKDDIVVNSGKIYRVNKDIEASDNTKFADLDTVEITTLPATVDLTVMMFVINVKSGTADSEYIYVNFSALAQTYTGDGESIEITADNIVKLINDDLDETTKKGVYPVQINKFGLITEYDEEIKVHKKSTGTIAVGDTTTTIALPIKSELINYRVNKADGTVVITDVEITEATDTTAGSITFGITEAMDSALSIVVNYVAPF